MVNFKTQSHKIRCLLSGFGVGLYKAGDPCSDEYRGIAANSEPETKGLQYGFNKYLPNITSALSLHRLVLWSILFNGSGKGSDFF